MRSWEVTQVNEMLVAMESHPLPFACTTNAFDALDPATLRRFLFKVGFRPMTADQIATAFRRIFAVEPPRDLLAVQPPRDLLAVQQLTPGDFALVARKAKVFCESDPTRLAGWLIEEVAAKIGGRLTRIGF